MSLQADVRVVCNRCAENTTVPMDLTNSSGEPHFKFTSPVGWTVRDMGSLRTMVLCPRCTAKEYEDYMANRMLPATDVPK
jgi:hypothetical protein